MATIFPLTPTIGDTYVSSGITWIWDGEAWLRSYTDDTVNTDTLVDILAQAYTITTNTATTIGSFSKLDYRTAEYIIQIKQGTNYYSSRAFLIHDGTNTKMAEYAILESTTGAIPVTISSVISTNNVVLQATVTNAATTNCEVKVLRTLVVI
jgi:hypothetical protein